ncbi:penicillin-binding transpeptidase domain-containing protein [Bdellovibrio bacteriovorus]|uniref:penicillin-binding transpeptidase domain-containing protein n=1 Tax=Bdellovibrio TaxID=958 RepID=UPI0035A8CE41
MKNTTTILISTLIALNVLSCSSKEMAKPEPAPKKMESYFPNVNGCFLLYDMKNSKWVEEFNPERCKERTAPCSTFKVPLALAAFDAGVLKDENTLYKWDGKQRWLPDWNKDQTAASWMKYSTVWYSQRITEKMGRKKVQSYLNKLEYGNKDFSGGLDDAWLTPKASVLISGYEQIEFWKKLWTNSLPVSQKSLELTRKLTFLETTPRGFTLHGKTGSGNFGVDNGQRLGWFVAHIEGQGKEYLAVVTLNDLTPTSETGGGRLAKEALLAILKDRGLY